MNKLTDAEKIKRFNEMAQAFEDHGEYANLIAIINQPAPKLPEVGKAYVFIKKDNSCKVYDIVEKIGDGSHCFIQDYEYYINLDNYTWGLIEPKRRFKYKDSEEFYKMLPVGNMDKVAIFNAARELEDEM